MPGRATAVKGGTEIESAVAEIARDLGLDVFRQVVVGRRIWGAVRKIDVVLRHPTTHHTIGIECKFQGVAVRRKKRYPRLFRILKLGLFQASLFLQVKGFPVICALFFTRLEKLWTWLM